MWAILIIVGAVIYGIAITCIESFQVSNWFGIIVTASFILFIIYICICIWGQPSRVNGFSSKTLNYI